MGYLREHRDQALAAVRALVYVDGTKSEGESEILQQIEEMLG